MDLNIILVLVSTFISFIDCSHRFKITEPDQESYVSNSLTKYIMYHEKISFNEARTICQDIGGDLAAIDSEQTFDSILELVDEKYESRNDFFRDDYWLGLIQSTANNFHWVHDCSPLSWIANYESGWKDSELCIKHHKDQHIGSKDPCNSDRAFMCQISTDEPCMYLPRLESTTLTNSDNTPCQEQCSNMTYCWGTTHIDEDNSCMHLVTSGYGSSSVNLTTKFCLEVAVDSSSFKPAVQDDSKIPNQNCTPAAPLTSSSSIVPTTSSTILPTSTSLFCPTVITTMTMTPSPVYITDVVNVTINVTDTTTEYVNITQTNTQYVSLTDTVSITETFTESINVTQTVTEFLNVTLTAYPIVNNISEEEAEERAEELIKNLTVDEKTTSAYRRTLISAEDKRTVSQCMGYIGIIVIVVPLCILILGDLQKVFSDFRSHINVYRHSNVRKPSPKSNMNSTL